MTILPTRRIVLALILTIGGSLMTATMSNAASVSAPSAGQSHQNALNATARQSAATAQAVRLVINSAGTVAHYRVREHLAFFSFPTDAVGTTNSVSGAIVLNSGDRIVAAQSKIIVDLRTLKTDQSRRDQFVQSNTLQTDLYPYAVFVVQQAQGIPAQLPASGKISFKLVGDLTIHGVTRSATWAVSATLTPQTVTGTASTHFSMTTFNITPPQIGPVLGVDSTVRLDISVTMSRHALSHV